VCDVTFDGEVKGEVEEVVEAEEDEEECEVRLCVGLEKEEGKEARKEGDPGARTGVGIGTEEGMDICSQDQSAL
jgi:hypothetical protein